MDSLPRCWKNLKLVRALYRTSKFTTAPAWTFCPAGGACETMILAGEACAGGGVAAEPVCVEPACVEAACPGD